MKNKKRLINIIVFSAVGVIALATFGVYWLCVSILHNNKSNICYSLIILIVVLCVCVSGVILLYKVKHSIKLKARLVDLYTGHREYLRKLGLKRGAHPDGNMETQHYYATIEYELNGEQKRTEIDMNIDSGYTWLKLKKNDFINKEISILIYRNEAIFNFKEFYNEYNNLY